MIRDTITIILCCFLISTSMSTTATPSHSFIFNYSSYMIPHPEKAHRGGEDAFFDSPEMLVIADGVGGWNNQGIDPSDYSRFLCSESGRHLQENKTECVKNPLGVIKRAQSKNENVGSATMEVLTVDGNLLRYCYIGDSGFMVIRKYSNLIISIFEFVEQQHGFNFPYQLALPKYGGDDPNLSICGTLELQEGDIIVAGSDGLYDNFDFYEVLNRVRKAVEKSTLLTTLAEELATTAIKRGSDPKFKSPFSRRAKEQGLSYDGGKLDDTTVIVAQVRRKSKQEIIVEL